MSAVRARARRRRRGSAGSWTASVGGSIPAVDPDGEPGALRIVSVASTVATGRPLAATSSSTVARPSTRPRAIRPAVLPRSAIVPGARGAAREPCSRPRSSSSCGIPATMRALPGNSRRNARQPALSGAPMEPGTRKHSRPCSSAHDAVISAPLRAGASTTTVASESPLMIRFRRGNVPFRGSDIRGRAPTRRHHRRPRSRPRVPDAPWDRGWRDRHR